MTARYNAGLGETILFKNAQRYSEGSFKIAFRGTYASGQRRGEYCIVKIFKDNSQHESAYFNNELDIVNKTMAIVRQFNQAGVLPARTTVRVNMPDIVQLNGSSRRALVEPYIEGFEKFNTNSGWAKNHTEGGQAMQALSHFSYHNSGGRQLLCDVQGGETHSGFVLTDPIIMTRSGNLGPGDLGAEGISNFFSHHRCGQFCKKSWMLPAAAGYSPWPRSGTLLR